MTGMERMSSRTKGEICIGRYLEITSIAVEHALSGLEPISGGQDRAIDELFRRLARLPRTSPPRTRLSMTLITPSCTLYQWSYYAAQYYLNPIERPVRGRIFDLFLSLTGAERTALYRPGRVGNDGRRWLCEVRGWLGNDARRW
jgi:hypothetical protein